MRPRSKTIQVDECETAEFTISNTGSASASITDVAVSGFDDDEMTYTVITPPSFPVIISAGNSRDLDISFCPLKVDDYDAEVCIRVSGVNICKTLAIHAEEEGAGETDQNQTTGPSEPDDFVMEIEDQDGVYFVFINSSTGPIEGATIEVTYSDGTVETYTTNSLGKVSFTPLGEKFTVKMTYDDETLQKRVDTRAGRLTIGRVLIDLLMIAILMGLGVFLDERLG